MAPRGSPLALAQVDLVSALLRQAHPGLKMAEHYDQDGGDEFLDISLATAGGKGLFTKEIEDQLLAGKINLAVHSLKDLPTELPPGLALGAVLPGKTPAMPFSRSATIPLTTFRRASRARPAAFAHRARTTRPASTEPEGGGDSRERRHAVEQTGGIDALILAVAGLKRLGLTVKYQPIDIAICVPGPRAGIIGCEVREGDLATEAALAAINHAATLACAEAERVFLQTLGGGCQLRYAGHATITGETLRLIGASSNRSSAAPDVTGDRATRRPWACVPPVRFADESDGQSYLVEASPGSGLLTLRGKECLERADVVVYDHLSNPTLLRHARPDVELIFAGKQASQHTMTQDEQRLPGRARQSRGDRDPPQGRRSVCVWPRQRGSRGTRQAGDSVRDRSGDQFGHRRAGVCGHPGNAPGRWRQRSW